MKVFDFYKDFSCIAGACRHSCCRGGWEIDIDEKTAALYGRAGGDFADRVRKSLEIYEEDGIRQTAISLKNGQCPFFNPWGLCDIILNMGEDAIGLVCREYPRYTQRMGNDTERTLSISCEEAGRLLFSKKDRLKMVEAPASFGKEEAEETGGCRGTKAFPEEAGEDDEIGGELLEKIRQGALDILQNRHFDMRTRLSEYLEFCRKIQSYVNRLQENGEAEASLRAFLKGCGLDTPQGAASPNESEMRAEPSAEGVKDPGKKSECEEICLGAFEERLGMLQMMTVLDDEWQRVITAFEEVLEKPAAYFKGLRESVGLKTAEDELNTEHLMSYFTYRYFPRALQDGNVLGKAEFALLSFLVIRDMVILGTGEDMTDIARKFSREVEHADDNVDILMEELLFSDTLKQIPVRTLLGSDL